MCYPKASSRFGNTLMRAAGTPIANGWLTLRLAQGRGLLPQCCAWGDGNFSIAKSVGSGVSELRLDFGPGYRIYFGRDGLRLVILLGGGSKRRQQRDIETAQELWAEYRKYKKED